MSFLRAMCLTLYEKLGVVEEGGGNGKRRGSGNWDLYIKWKRIVFLLKNNKKSPNFSMNFLTICHRNHCIFYIFIISMISLLVCFIYKLNHCKYIYIKVCIGLYTFLVLRLILRVWNVFLESKVRLLCIVNHDKD